MTNARSLVLASLVLLLPLGAPSLRAQQFCEEEGLVVMEVESVPPAGSWVEESSLAGASGTYYRWAGADQFNTPGVGILSYTIQITTPGTYNLRIRNYHDNPDVTLENDCWVRMNSSPWTKVYSALANTWLWQSVFDPASGPDVDASYVLSAGTHTLQISGRSFDFRIDRIHLYLDSVDVPLALFYDETLCPTSGWDKLGNGLAGTNGTAVLAGNGELTAGSTTTITAASGLAFAPAWIVLGTSAVDAPFKQGVLVPTPTFALPVALGGGGGLTLVFSWPAGLPSGFELYYQLWFVDAGGPAGFAASNGLLSTTP